MPGSTSIAISAKIVANLMDESPALLKNERAARGDGVAIWLPRIAIILLFMLAAISAWRAGLAFRHWTWDTTASIRYVTRDTGESGIDHDYEWARKAAVEGTLNQYEKMQLEKPQDQDWLDDAPLRLAVMSQWGKWSVRHFPKVARWSDDHSYALAAPLLHFDLFMELVGLVSAFCLVRLWVIRGRFDGATTPALRYSEEAGSSNASAGAVAQIQFSQISIGSRLKIALSHWPVSGRVIAVFWILFLALNPAVVYAGFWLNRDLLMAIAWLLAAASFCTLTTQQRFFRGCIPAAIAVLLLWFNPAIVLNAYGWPAFDLWIIPLFLLAALLATLNWWFAAGVIIGVGTMFDVRMAMAIPVFFVWTTMLHGWPKWPVRIAGPIAIFVVVCLAFADWKYAGQDWLQTVSLLVTEGAIFATVMLLWSLTWRPLAPLRFASGVVIAIALVASPSLLTYLTGTNFQAGRTVDVPAVLWLLCVLAAAIGLPWVAWLTLELPAQSQKPAPRSRLILASPWAWRIFASLGAIVLVMWPWMLKRNHPQWWIGVAATIAMIVAVQLIRPRGIPYVAAAAIGSALLLCMPLFHGSTAWYNCGLHFATIHHPRMTVGYTDNLPGILVSDFDWPMLKLKITAFTIPAHYLARYPATATDITIGGFLQTLFLGTLAICCIGTGMHASRRSSRVLVALTAGWLMLFAFAPQISERCLLFAAGISCICAGASTGMTLLGVLLSIISFVMTLHQMIASATPMALHAFGKELARQCPKLFSQNAGEKLRQAINGTYPDLGYAVILCALCFLYVAIAPSKKDAEV